MTARRSRRALLREGVALAALGVVGTTSGCLGFFGGEEELGRLSTVPIGSEFAVHADIDDILADDPVRQGADEELADDDVLLDGAESVDDLLTEVREETGLDVNDISELLAFGQFVASEGEQPFLGTIVWTEWPEEDVRAALELAADITEDSYNGRTVYTTEDVWVAVLDDGVYASGSPLTIRSLIDLREAQTDEGDPEDEEVAIVTGGTRDGYLAARDEGYLKYGFEVDATSISSIPAEAVNQPLLEDVDYGYGAVYTEEDERIGELVLQATGSSEAEDLRSILNGAVALGQERDEELGEKLLDRLLLEAADSMSVSRDGDVVRLEYRNDAEASGSVLVRLVAILEGAIVQF